MSGADIISYLIGLAVFLYLSFRNFKKVFEQGQKGKNKERSSKDRSLKKVEKEKKIKTPPIPSRTKLPSQRPEDRHFPIRIIKSEEDVLKEKSSRVSAAIQKLSDRREMIIYNAVLKKPKGW